MSPALRIWLLANIAISLAAMPARRFYLAGPLWAELLVSLALAMAAANAIIELIVQRRARKLDQRLDRLEHQLEAARAELAAHHKRIARGELKYL